MFSYLEAAAFLGCCPLYLIGEERPCGVSIDSRTLSQGDLFVALKGIHYDGHQFLGEAFARGASGALVSEDQLPFPGKGCEMSGCKIRNILPVKSPEKSLARLAGWHRSRFPGTCFGITGSVGKTSTKDFLCYLLELKEGGRVLATRGNCNNHLGLPLTILALRENHRICVAELGANHPGEIEFLARILCPTAGLITRVSPCHLEGFGSLEAIYSAKLELFHALGKGSVAVIPDDDPVLAECGRELGLRTVTVGQKESSDYRMTGCRLAGGRVTFEVNGRFSFAFPGNAGFFARNALMALALAEAAGGFSLDTFPDYWEGMRLADGRFTLHEMPQGVRIIFDGYNSSPESFAKALESLIALPAAGRKIVGFSDMLELGSEEKFYHQRLGETLAELRLDGVFAYGCRARWSLEALRALAPDIPSGYYETAGELACFLQEFIKPGDVLLLKASRGMKIETVLRQLSDGQRLPEEKILSAGLDKAII